MLDGRPMSGDIGRGTTRESIAFAVHLAAAKVKPPGAHSNSLFCEIVVLYAYYLTILSGTGQAPCMCCILFHLHLLLGFLQLAGGTNAHTVYGLKTKGLFQTTFITGMPIPHDLNYHDPSLFLGFVLIQCLIKESTDDMKPIGTPHSLHALIGGIAYGSYARKIVGRPLSSMQVKHGHACIEDHSEYLLEALEAALGLVGTVKCYNPLLEDQ
uniref:Uncharacterized protein MANES_15G004200 n=1 Tax=Rhizophora mucronata TaxID=61149 RepID=A0A2P2LNS4_RHIMU